MSRSKQGNMEVQSGFAECPMVSVPIRRLNEGMRVEQRRVK